MILVWSFGSSSLSYERKEKMELPNIGVIWVFSIENEDNEHSKQIKVRKTKTLLWFQHWFWMCDEINKANTFDKRFDC